MRSVRWWHTPACQTILKIGKIAGSLDFRRLSLEPTSFAYNFSDVGVELAKRWRFPDNFATVITFFSDPLAEKPFDPMSATVHIAAWRASAEENKYSEQEAVATFPQELATQLLIEPEVILSEMPPLPELAAGLEDLLN